MKAVLNDAFYSQKEHPPGQHKDLPYFSKQNSEMLTCIASQDPGAWSALVTVLFELEATVTASSSFCFFVLKKFKKRDFIFPYSTSIYWTLDNESIHKSLNALSA